MTEQQICYTSVLDNVSEIIDSFYDDGYNEDKEIELLGNKMYIEAKRMYLLGFLNLLKSGLQATEKLNHVVIKTEDKEYSEKKEVLMQTLNEDYNMFVKSDAREEVQKIKPELETEEEIKFRLQDGSKSKYIIQNEELVERDTSIIKDVTKEDTNIPIAKPIPINVTTEKKEAQKNIIETHNSTVHTDTKPKPIENIKPIIAPNPVKTEVDNSKIISNDNINNLIDGVAKKPNQNAEISKVFSLSPDDDYIDFGENHYQENVDKKQKPKPMPTNFNFANKQEAIKPEVVIDTKEEMKKEEPINPISDIKVVDNHASQDIKNTSTSVSKPIPIAMSSPIPVVTPKPMPTVIPTPIVTPTREATKPKIEEKATQNLKSTPIPFSIPIATVPKSIASSLAKESENKEEIKEPIIKPIIAKPIEEVKKEVISEIPEISKDLDTKESVLSKENITEPIKEVIKPKPIEVAKPIDVVQQKVAETPLEKEIMTRNDFCYSTYQVKVDNHLIAEVLVYPYENCQDDVNNAFIFTIISYEGGGLRFCTPNEKNSYTLKETIGNYIFISRGAWKSRVFKPTLLVFPDNKKIKEEDINEKNKPCLEEIKNIISNPKHVFMEKEINGKTYIFLPVTFSNDKSGVCFSCAYCKETKMKYTPLSNGQLIIENITFETYWYKGGCYEVSEVKK